MSSSPGLLRRVCVAAGSGIVVEVRRYVIRGFQGNVFRSRLCRFVFRPFVAPDGAQTSCWPAFPAFRPPRRTPCWAIIVGSLLERCTTDISVFYFHAQRHCHFQSSTCMEGSWTTSLYAHIRESSKHRMSKTRLLRDAGRCGNPAQRIGEE